MKIIIDHTQKLRRMRKKKLNAHFNELLFRSHLVHLDILCDKCVHTEYAAAELGGSLHWNEHEN